ncbi:peptidase S15 [Candidatus Koribacter versatilis Ellin345]|uniref:Peptidase S15 n=1 Tax=Koribacter versatilis (strain Ellin345) TaxID=204669 RepID=Q1IMS9_KORVE|nr:CocE/NonD family hydrolase [Candidatus Koribacter versatilis]ABF41821.1 peptidase S15 [Candidatus Koribacter versatilis Ellin345]
MYELLLKRVLLGILAIVWVTAAVAQDDDDANSKFDVKAHYTKYEYRIPMRDGVRLFTAVYVPKDQAKPYPFMMERTPYTVGPYGSDNYPKNVGPAQEFAEAGYIFVYQDVRGRWMSEGKWEEMTPHIDHPNGPKDVDESTDTYDTVEWLLKHVPNNNGKVGIWGISYPGFYASASIIDSHPAIKAASPQAPVTDLYMGDDAYHNGAFMLAANFGFYTSFKQEKAPLLPPKNGQDFDFGTEDGYEYYLKLGALANSFKVITDEFNPLWRDQVVNTTYDDYWKKRNIAAHLHNIHCAVLNVGGWFDAEDVEGPMKTFRTIAKNDPDTVNILVEGPWAHFTWSVVNGNKMGRVVWGSDTAKYFRAKIEFRFFEYYLKGEGDGKFPKAYAFETGTNVWRQYSSWPPAGVQAKTLYFREGGKLSFEAPNTQGFDEYVSDPNRPVPFVGYTTNDVPQEYMVSDQRFASKRTDVLTYQTDPLEEDVTIAGPIAPKLFVSTTGTDSDFDVKLIDVYPSDYPDPEEKSEKFDDVKLPTEPMTGYQQLLRGEPFRGKFRHSFEKPEPFTPGKTETIEFTMPDVHHTFRRGHRIMVQIQSSWFPLTDRNPQTFTDIPTAKAEQFVKATERVYRQNGAASGVGVMVLPAK